MDQKLQRTTDYNMSCYHEEADTKIVYHICELVEDCSVIIHCSDSDIPIIMLSKMKFLKADKKIKVCISVKNKKRYIDINAIYSNLKEDLSRAIAVFQIFTGNDFNPAFFRKGKKRPFTILKNNVAFQKAFVKLINLPANQLLKDDGTFSDHLKTIEEFVCRMYSLKTLNDVNKGRFELFDKSYKTSSENEKIIKSKLIGFNASTLPPCRAELLQQVKRTIYISSVWCNAHLRSPTELEPENWGWMVVDNKLEFYWFDGDQSPSMAEITLTDDADEGNDHNKLYNYFLQIKLPQNFSLSLQIQRQKEQKMKEPAMKKVLAQAKNLMMNNSTLAYKLYLNLFFILILFGKLLLKFNCLFYIRKLIFFQYILFLFIFKSKEIKILFAYLQ